MQVQWFEHHDVVHNCKETPREKEVQSFRELSDHKKRDPLQHHVRHTCPVAFIRNTTLCGKEKPLGRLRLVEAALALMSERAGLGQPG